MVFITIFPDKIMYLLKLNIASVLLLTSAVLLTNIQSSVADSNFTNINQDQTSKKIKGQSGGFNDSQGCGFIGNDPDYEMNLKQRIDYMRFTVEADGGQPTLLVVGPNAEDSFCVLGDEIIGLKPEISGVWEAGYYQIYVGDRTGSQHNFILDISTDN